MADWLLAFADFHFLRPLWLLLLAPAVWLGWVALRANDAMFGWKGVMAPHLLQALVVDPEQSRVDRQRNYRRSLQPGLVLALSLLLGALAMAGPTWKMQDTPFAQDQAALVLVIHVSDSMLSQDIQPSRLQRAVQKAGDLLASKAGSSSGLIAYAGSAHLAMPVTTDPEIVLNFARALTPEAMPLPGNDVLGAVRLANEQLRRSGLAGSVLLLTDNIPREQIPALQEYRRNGGAPVHVLAVAAGPEVIPPAGSPPAAALDRDTISEATRAMGGSMSVVTADDTDIQDLSRNLERGIRAAPTQEGQQWQDMGIYLLPLLALLMLLMFRSGGAVQWH
jgi:Ca-activated chloride channel family protein